MINTKELLLHVDLAGMVEASLGRPGKRSGQWLFWPCPFHADDQTPSLGIRADEGRWFCFGCRKGGDAISWLREHEGMTFKAACEALGADRISPRTPVDRVMSKPPAAHLPDALQPAWKAVIERCQQLLWEPAGSRARDYLRQRGLKDATLQSPFVRAGYSPGCEIQGVWVDRGIVLPCFTTTYELEIEYVSYIKVRRAEGGPKYRKLSGGGANLAGLYGAEWVEGADVIFVAEGEFDALLLNQEAGDLVGVCTLGGAGDQPNFARFGKYFLLAKKIFITYDTDTAGQQGAKAWKALIDGVKTIKVPEGKDITEFWMSGGDLAGWVMETIQISTVTPLQGEGRL